MFACSPQDFSFVIADGNLGREEARLACEKRCRGACNGNDASTTKNTSCFRCVGCAGNEPTPCEYDHDLP